MPLYSLYVSKNHSAHKVLKPRIYRSIFNKRRDFLLKKNYYFCGLLKKTSMLHSIKPGVATGDMVQEIFRFAKEKGFALPAVNVTGSSTVNAVMETAAKLNSPVIIQFSNGGCCFNAGKSLSNENERAAIAGGIAGAKHVHQLAEVRARRAEHQHLRPPASHLG